MKEIVTKLQKAGVICRKFEKQDLKTRQKIECYFGYNLKNEYCIVFNIDRKSRFLQKDVDKLEEFVFMVRSNNFKNKKKILILNNTPLCSKAKDKLYNLGWRIL